MALTTDLNRYFLVCVIQKIALKCQYNTNPTQIKFVLVSAVVAVKFHFLNFREVIFFKHWL